MRSVPFARLYLALCAALALVAPAAGQSSTLSSPSAAPCPPVTGTLASANDTVVLTCPGAPGYEILITPNASTPLIGTLQAYDPVSGSNRALFKAGVGALDVSSALMTGTTGATLYRLVSFNGGAVKLSAYTSGSATVTIWASTASSGSFQNNPVHTTEEGALRNGRAFTASSSVQAIPAGSYLNFYIANPANNSLRLIVQTRYLSCSNAGNTTPLQYFGISNPTNTGTVAATAATVSNRRTGGAVSASTSGYGVNAARLDSTPTTAAPVGGQVPTGGISFFIPGLTTIEPGTSRGNFIFNPTGAGNATISCSITYQWVEEVTN